MITSTDVLFSFSTLYWISGFYILLMNTLNGATRVITKQKFSPELQLRLIEQYHISFILNAAHQMVMMTKCKAIEQANLKSLKYYLVGGSKVFFGTVTEMKKFVRNGEILVCYGLTEVGISTSTYLSNASKDSVGFLFNGVRAKIIDADGQQCGIGIDGEICMKGNYKFLGYYNNEKETIEVFADDGFVKTGDVGHFDDNGHLHVVDRKKEMLKYCNYPISPTEIEEFLMKSSNVKEVCVAGIPDDKGDLPAAVVVRKNCNLTREELHNIVSSHFADHYKLRGGIYFVNALPVTPSGKIIRRKVKEIAIQMSAEKIY